MDITKTQEEPRYLLDSYLAEIEQQRMPKPSGCIFKTKIEDSYKKTTLPKISGCYESLIEGYKSR